MPISSEEFDSNFNSVSVVERKTNTSEDFLFLLLGPEIKLTSKIISRMESTDLTIACIQNNFSVFDLEGNQRNKDVKMRKKLKNLLN